MKLTKKQRVPGVRRTAVYQQTVLPFLQSGISSGGKYFGL